MNRITAGDVIGFSEKDGRVTLSDGDFQRLLNAVRDPVELEFGDALLRVKAAGDALAAARVEEATAFLRYRMSGAHTDNQAKAQAIVETGSQLDKAMAEWVAACAYLEIATDLVAREGK